MESISIPVWAVSLLIGSIISMQAWILVKMYAYHGDIKAILQVQKDHGEHIDRLEEFKDQVNQYRIETQKEHQEIKDWVNDNFAKINI